VPRNLLSNNKEKVGILNKEVIRCFSRPICIIKIVKLRELRGVANIVRLAVTRHAYRILMEEHF
jgi:hypothetical protein